MKILLIGSGAREHALAWALSRSPKVDQLLCLPGNPGMARLGAVIEGVGPTDVGAVAALARVHGVDLVVVGPEAPLAAGVVDAVGRLGIPVFGPSKAAARLESSKTFAKEAMDAAGVPTPGSATFDDPGPAYRYLTSTRGPYVIKADGLAAGKGVLVSDDLDAARRWVDRCFDGAFGDAGSRVVIEEHVAGPELSVFAICDGNDPVPLAPARDYKRLRDGDAGPNTGGMGSYSPVELDPGLVDEVMETVFRPILGHMADTGHPYVGFLYAGLILGANGPRVIEFNARLGDPETQVVLPRLNTDLVDLIEAALAGDVRSISPAWSPRAAVNIVLASKGYPESTETGMPIAGAEQEQEDVVVFHAGTALDGRRLVTDGGRVLSVVGIGDDLASARSRAYAAADTITFPGKTFRTDIAL